MRESKGIPKEGGPIRIMLIEHEEGRNYIRNLDNALKNYFPEKLEKVKKEIITNALGYVELLNQHIFKEDNILYPMGNNLFSPRKQEELIEQFEEAKKSW